MTRFNYSGVQVEELTPLVGYSMSGGASYGALKQLIKPKNSGYLTISISVVLRTHLCMLCNEIKGEIKL